MSGGAKHAAVVVGADLVADARTVVSCCCGLSVRGFILLACGELEYVEFLSWSRQDSISSLIRD